MNLSVLLLLLSILVISSVEAKKGKKDLEAITSTVYFDIEIGGVSAGRILIGLFGEVS